jgi:uncharacterized OB-fold protein
VTDQPVAKPLPEPTIESQPYWDGMAQRRLMLQKCGGCGRILHYPRPMCDACYSTDVVWTEASGRGKVHSWTITYQAFNPAFRDELPMGLATVDLDEGVRMVAQLRGVDPDSLSIGLPVRVDYEDVGEGLTLPFLRADPPG